MASIRKRVPLLYYFVPLVIALIVFVVLMIIQWTSGTTDKPLASKGKLTITSQDQLLDEGNTLDGEWEFYWNELLEPLDFAAGKTGQADYVHVPSSWHLDESAGEHRSSKGYATYHLVVQLPQTDTGLGLLLKGITSASRIWINGKLVSENGTVGRSEAESNPYMVPSLLHLDAGLAQADIVIQVSNYTQRKAGLFDSLTLGKYDSLNDLMKQKLVFESLLIGCVLIMGLYHIVLFILLRKNWESLFFGLICVLLAMKNSAQSQYILSIFFHSLNDTDFIKIEYLGFLGSTPLFVMFFYYSFPGQMTKRMRAWLSVPGVLLTLFIAVSPVQVYTSFALVLQIYAAVVGLILLQYVVKAAMNRVPGANLMLAGAFIFFLTVVNDILMSNQTIRTGTYFPYGLLSLIICLSIIVSTKFSNALKTNERLSSRLLDLDKVKDEFLANTSHELRTPLNGIIGLAQSLLHSMDDRMEDTQRVHLNMIVSSGQRMSYLINDILDYALLNNNDMRLHITKIDLHQLTQVVLTVVKPLVTGRNVVLTNQIGTDFPPIYADDNRMQQVMFNLVGNAIKYTPSGHVIVSAVHYNGHVEIHVEDTGIGIAEDKFEMIFNPFEKLESIDDTGTGLGLKITKQLVELHGGEISVSSKLGMGSIFSFTIRNQPVDGSVHLANRLLKQPRKARDTLGVNTSVNVDELAATSVTAAYHPTLLSLDSEQMSAQRPYRVLVVDDESVNLQVAIQQLTSLSCVFETATSGAEVLARIDELHEVDLVIADLMMIGMSGYELCGLIRERYSLIELPILIMTASNRDQTIEACFRAGANDYISKPIGRNELVSRVLTLLQLKRSVEELSLNAQQLAELNEQLSELNTNLEHRIGERTMELQRKNKNLRSLELSRRRLLSDISHELRTPMTAIQGYVEAIVSGLVEHEEDKNRYLQMVLVKALGLNRLIHDLFELSRLESGKSEMVFVMMPLQELVSTIKDKFMLDVVRAKMQYDFQLICDPAKLDEYQVVIDMDRITQVLTNLVFNAIQHTGAEGRIRIRCEVEEWQTTEEDTPGKLTISVEDNGAGIGEDSLPFVFDRFFREKRNPAIQGSGIGLAIAKEIVQYHEGEIHVHSTLGVGSTFYFTLPLYVMES
ncbi:ATP-binding protein [Paenibacillus amylolyticus]|uniref:ATP-binding protein n=1 Tax=Paenibacillus amylolyticus TaxID=1451 RepID=UPI003EB90449